MRSARIVLNILLAAMLAAFSLDAFAAPDADDIVVKVEHRGSWVVIDVDLPLEVSPDEAWPTLADYEHMADFLPDLVESRVLSRDGNRLHVLQKGRARRGPFSFAFENVREVVLVPPIEIRTHLLSGTLKEAVSTTRLVPTRTGSRLHNHGEYVPADWVPVALAAGLIASEAREQFALLRAEIMRRNGKVGTLQ